MALLILAGASLAFIAIGKGPFKIIAAISFTVAVVFLARDSVMALLRDPSGSELNAIAAKKFDEVSSDKDLLSFIVERPCDTISSTPSLRKVIRKAVSGNYQKGLKAIEQNFIKQIQNAADTTTPALISCYSEISAGITEKFRLQNSIHAFSKLWTISKNAQDYQKTKEVTATIRTQISAMETLEKDFETAKKDLIYLKGFVVGEHDHGLYEIRYNYGQTAFLVTKKTQFTSKGLFELYARKQGVYNTKKTEQAGGFSVTVPIYEEQPNVAETFKQIEQNKALLAAVKIQLSQAEEKLKATHDELKKSLIEISKASLKEAHPDRSTASSN